MKLEFFHPVNKSWFISLFHRKETEQVIKTAGKVTLHELKNLLD